MTAKSANACIAAILRDIEKRRSIDPADFSNRNLVRRYNAAMDRIRENAHFLWTHYPDQRELFVQLVRLSDCDISSHCAHILYGMPDATIEHKRIALATLRELVENPELPEPSRFGISLNIKRWEAEMSK